MQIEERVVDDVTILDLKGKMTLGEGDELLKDKIASLVVQSGKEEDSPEPGSGAVHRQRGPRRNRANYTSISRQNGRLKLLNVSKRVQDLLVITKLITISTATTAKTEAVKSFAA